MKYPQISSLVPKGEHFDESAINGEGAWLTTTHVDSIENFLVSQASAVQQAKDALTASEATVNDLNSQIETLNTAATSSATTISSLNDRITQLESENKTLGGQSSGKGTTLVVTKDEKVNEGDNKKVTLNSAEHPLNQFAAQRVAAASKKK